MTLLALCCSAKINVASPLTINLKPWQTMTQKNTQKNPQNNNKKTQKISTTTKRRNTQAKEEKKKV